MTDRQVHKFIMAVLEMSEREYNLFAGPVEPDEERGPDWREHQSWREEQEELADCRAAQNGTL